MNEKQRQQLYARYTVVVRDVVATLGTRDGLAWLRKNKPVAHVSVARLESLWALEKHRREVS